MHDRTMKGLQLLGAIVLLAYALPVSAQIPTEGEVRQLVTFSFAAGRSAGAMDVFRRHAIPLYEGDEDMLSFRAFREVESSIPLDLIVVSSFQGMEGMDRSNAVLSEAGIGTFYGQVGPWIDRHTDQFVTMLPALGSGDPSTGQRTALIWYRVLPGESKAFEDALLSFVVPWEEAQGIPSTTGRFLLSDGWDYLRVIGVDSLGDYEAYWSGIRGAAGYDRLVGLTAERREVIVAAVRDMFVR
ncbi:MAG: hypothetical protein ACR2QM_13165 [Longimicrobiales bacterium]